ncbi:hypothetical protein TNCV_1171161 [Trichonephila clavipes]|nr:hypothetical protein TNCV_1171161 [Trichonephila clavipes]
MSISCSLPFIVSQRSDDYFKISVDSVTTLATDLGIDPEFPVSKLKKKVHIFVYEGRDKPASNSSSNSRTLRQMDDLPHYLSAIRYSAFCMSFTFLDDDLMKT